MCHNDRSGTEEEYSEINQLMEDAATYNNDFQKEKAEQRNTNKAKEERDKQQGLAFRDAAMNTLRRSKAKLKQKRLYQNIITVLTLPFFDS